MLTQGQSKAVWHQKHSVAGVKGKLSSAEVYVWGHCWIPNLPVSHMFPVGPPWNHLAGLLPFFEPSIEYEDSSPPTHFRLEHPASQEFRSSLINETLLI